MIEMPITLEPYESYCNRLIEETHKMVKEMHDIVHCKDCKYWAEFTFAQPTKNYCGRLIQADYNNHNFGFEMDADDFCSQGKLK